MAIDTKNLGSINAYHKLASLPTEQARMHNPNAVNTTADENSLTTEKPSKQVTQMTIRNERQASLVAHLFGNGQSAETQSLKLTYQAAIEKLNEVLMAEIPQAENGETAPAPISEEALKSQGGMEYWTPENTAKRIVDGATGFLAGFQNAHPELQGAALMDKFLEVVGGGLTQGFEEAKSLLGDLDVLKGDIADNIETTYQLVLDGMQNFKNQFLGISDSPEEPTETTSENPQTDKD
ncbi:hypothetical protein THMIRHAM_09250 [Thiomicrorhabdus immobilis]|uniref:DUF5610 domain-containing protein n=1 Tax=Thiomicrorhabdus immobilis TaxID=2791037 RepID=A0ABM7MCN3_9GAMM|nr:DUF5610 domain-containing protein [Thiomicrorhabdus immobilis]BCN93140.1 hypothetical protein THMIRHAM_09250 [Thiomicrorhabdus immobilis]